ncbi:MAG TPA: helix-turn-helix transcriptional regulator [Symbiobacteriaceae bacterium]|nr:helix-turn-helix transcriptional regulator [Symbiobacteriaceae bacterium]
MFAPHVRAGLLLAGLFGWLLAFPMFGPLLFATAGRAAPTAGLTFLFAHGAGLLLLHRLPTGGAFRQWLPRGAGVLVALLTLSFALGPAAAPAVVYARLAVIGSAAAVPVLAWVDRWMACEDRLAALAVAMAGANVVVALVSVRIGPAPWLWLALMALLAAGSAWGLGAPLPGPAAPPTTPDRPAPPVRWAAVAAFALADFLVGGLWYNSIATAVPLLGSWQPTVEALTYAAAIAILYRLVRGRHSGQLARFSLSALGMGLVVAAAGVGGAGTVPASRALLLFGLAAGDLFYWDQLGQLGTPAGGRRALGVGLGASLMLIGLANLGASLALPGEGGPGPLFLLCGAFVLFLVIPVVFRHAAETAAGTAAPAGVSNGPAPPLPAHMQAELTQAERQVYALLVTGATDQEIAARLMVTKHTVKFHVRNILHKADAANRKELLSHLVAEGVAATQQQELR